MCVGHYAKTKTVQIAEQKAPSKRQVEERATTAINESVKDISSQAEQEPVVATMGPGNRTYAAPESLNPKQFQSVAWYH